MKPTTKPTNQQIVGGFNRHETWIMPWLYDRCAAPVYEISAKILKNDVDAEDVTSEVFLKLCFVDDRKKTFKEISDLFYKAGKNLALDKLKKRHSEQKYVDKNIYVQSEIVEPEMGRNEKAAALYYLISQCKKKLTPQCRRVFDLYFIKQMLIPEIAREMRISEKRVSNLKATALKIMRLEIGPRKSFIFLLTVLS